MRYDVVVIGGGILGFASAMRLSEMDPSLRVAVLEKESAIAQHQSGRNSGVIHSGIYYRPGSEKAVNCREGRKSLIEFCDKYGIRYELCGKIIVATDTRELPQLETLFSRGIANDLQGIKKLNGSEIREHETHAAGIAGIFVPETGIVDYRVVTAKYAEIFKENGGEIFLNEKVAVIREKGEWSEVQTETNIYEAKTIVNCAGLYSDTIALLARKQLDMRIIPFRGEYYKVREDRRHLVRNLIYPVPDPAFPFLGVHFTRRVDGEVEAGPNAVFALKREGYTRFSFNMREFFGSISWPGFQKVAFRYWKTGAEEWYRSLSKAAFASSLQKLVPEIREEDLVPGGAGVRAQLCSRDGALVDDFVILESAREIDVLNAPSPAATSSLAIGAKIAGMVLERHKKVPAK